MAQKDVTQMTRKEFDALPHRGSWDEEVVCTSIVILPGRSRDMHDSGYRCMDFVAVDGNKPICRLSGCSDVIHIDGIGGYGLGGICKNFGKSRDNSAWSIDCLPKSGLLRLWPTAKPFVKPGCALSSFDLFAVSKEEIDADKTE